MNRDNQKFRLNYRCSCVLLFLILYINETIMFGELYSATFRGGATIGCFMLVCAYAMMRSDCKGIFMANKKMLFFYILLLACIGISILFNGINVTFDIYTVILMTIALMVVSVMDRENFYKAFTSVMTFLAMASVIIFLGYHILPKSIFAFFPNYYWHGGVLMKNCYLTVLQVSVQNYRNFGIFYEPGYYAVCLVWALFIALFKKEVNIRQVIILFAALATTLSTGGYIAGAMLIVIFVFIKSDIPSRTKKHIAVVMVVLVACISVFLTNNPSKLKFLTDKFTEVSIGTAVDLSGQGSGYERWRAVVYAVEAFFVNPIAGIGQKGWQVKFSSVIGTATPLNWFGLYGLIYGLCMNIFYLKNAVIRNENGHIRWMLSVALMVVLIWNISSQNMSRDIFLLIMVFYQAGASFAAEGYIRNNRI